MEFFNHWWNLPYLIMLGLVGAFFLLQIIGLVGHDADMDHDVDHDVDADVDHDVDADGGATVGFHEVMAFFGLGRVPFMVIWLTLCIFTGFSGLFLNRVVYAHRGVSVAIFFAVLAVALVIGLVGVRLFSRLAARFVDIGGKGSTAKHELAGRAGVVASAELDQRFGEVRVHDDAGNELLVHGHTEAGVPALPRGTRVVLIDYDADKGLFWVTSSPDTDVAPQAEPKQG